MSLEDDSRSLVDTIDSALRGSFGVDPDRDHDEVCALATTGYVVSCWRNTVLEDIHSGGFVPNARRGSYARDGIRDRDMARLNVATWRQIRPHVHPTGIDVMAVRDLLRDEKRPVTIGANTFTCGNLFADTWTKLVWHLNEGAWLPLDLAGRMFGGDEAAAMRYYAICGSNYAPDWFGNPWWEAAVTAWAKQNQPARVEDLNLALHTPNELDDNAIQWLMRAKYDSVFSDTEAPPMSPTRRGNVASGPMTHKALLILKDWCAGAPSQAPAHFEPILPEVATLTPRDERCSKGSGAVDRSVADRGDGRMGPRCHRPR